MVQYAKALASSSIVIKCCVLSACFQIYIDDIARYHLRFDSRGAASL